jgi:hypothetical protein
MEEKPKFNISNCSNLQRKNLNQYYSSLKYNNQKNKVLRNCTSVSRNKCDVHKKPPINENISNFKVVPFIDPEPSHQPIELGDFFTLKFESINEYLYNMFLKQ